MAINYYDGAGGGLFEDIGSVIKLSNTLATTQATYEAAVQVILDQFGDNDFEDEIEGLADAQTDWEQEYAARRAALVGYVTARLTEMTSVVEEVGAKSSSITEVLAKLIETMNDDADNVNASAPTVAVTGTAHADNTGTGKIALTKILDGYSAPGNGRAAHAEYKGLLTELIVPADTLRFRCTADSFENSAIEGQESFEWYGNPSPGSWAVDDGASAEASGDLGTLQTVEAGDILTNGAFEDWTANVPDDWTLDLGTAGTHILQDTDPADVFRGAAAVDFVGDNALATIQISQAIPATNVIANRRYVVSFWFKSEAAISGDLTVILTGTGYTAGSATGDNYAAGVGVSQADESLTVQAATLATLTSWTLGYFFVNMPTQIPDDLEIVVKVTGTPAAAKHVWVDDLRLAPVSWGAGLGVAVIPGATAFSVNDRFTAAISATEGVVQKWFRRAYGVQLPSNAAAGETIPDSVAT